MIGAKCYRLQYRIGRARYVVSYHDGRKRHADGSPFYDLRIFANNRVCTQFVRALQADGYRETGARVSA